MRSFSFTLILTLGLAFHLSGCSVHNASDSSDQKADLSATLTAVKTEIAQGHLESAQVTLKRIDSQLSASEAEELIEAWLSLAAAYREMGKFAVATHVLEQALAVAKANRIEARQSDILNRMKVLTEAEKAETSLVVTELHSKENARYSASREFRKKAQMLQLRLSKSKSFEKASAQLEPLLQEAKELKKKGANEMLLVMAVLEDLYTRFQKYDRCVAMYEEHLQALPMKLEELDAADPQSIETAREQIASSSAIARMRVLQKRYVEAEKYATRSYEITKAAYGPTSKECRSKSSELAEIKTKARRPSDAGSAGANKP